MTVSSLGLRTHRHLGFVLAVLTLMLFWGPRDAWSQQDCSTDGTPPCTYIPYGQTATIYTNLDGESQSQKCENVTNNCLNGADELMVPFSTLDEWSGQTGFLNADIVTGAHNIPACVTISTCKTTPSVTLTANPTTINTIGSTIVLTWTVTNASSCLASSTLNDPNWTGSKSASGGNTSPFAPPLSGSNISITYTLTCTDAKGDQGSGSATVTYQSLGGGNPPCVAYKLFGTGTYFTEQHGLTADPYLNQMAAAATAEDTLAGVVPSGDLVITSVIPSMQCALATQNPTVFSSTYISDCQAQPNLSSIMNSNFSLSGSSSGQVFDGTHEIDWTYNGLDGGPDGNGGDQDTVRFSISRQNDGTCAPVGCVGNYPYSYPDVTQPCPALVQVGRACAINSGHGGNDHGHVCLYYGHYSCQSDGSWLYTGVTCLDQ